MKPAAIRRAYLREAFVAIVLARMAVRFVPPSRVFAWANRPPRRINRFAADEANWIFWAVEQMASRTLCVYPARSQRMPCCDGAV